MSHLVSVIIPVKNGQEFLDEVLSQVIAQQTDFSYEVIVIDSGSTDKSLEIIGRYPHIKLIKILPHSFNHGLTRNFGVENASGEFIAFITQDATPANEHWLQKLVTPLREKPEVAGVFGKHLARSGHDPIVAASIAHHFDCTISKDRSFWCKDENYEQQKSVYIFFSNNNSCIRRSVWEKVPFRKVEMSEDQWWAQDIIEQGYVKCYEPSAMVFHSHSYSPLEWFYRQFDEYRAYKKLGLVQPNSKRSTIKLIAKLSAHDIKYIYRTSCLPLIDKIYWSNRRILCNIGLVFGQFCGVRYDNHLVEAMQDLLSQQSRNIKAK